MEEQSKKKYLEATGFSMWPFLRNDDRVIIDDIPAKELRPGQIIVYKAGDKQICHRLVSKDRVSGKYLLFTRGDYVPCWRTEKVLEEQLLGAVSGIVRSGRLISLSGTKNAFRSRCIIVFFPVLAFAFSNLRRILKKP